MPISISTLKPGDVVFDARMEKMGNTTMRRLSVWKVYIKEVDLENGKVLASWNGNTPRTYYARSGKLPWRRSDPTRKRSLPMIEARREG